MKKIIIGMLIILLLTGCGNNTPRGAVDKYLKRYKTLDSEVLLDLENTIKEENLTSKNEEKYRDVLKKQYKDLNYEIISEEYDEEVSYVTVKIEVYDLYKIIQDSEIYLENNPQEFTNSDGVLDEDKYMSFRFDKMMTTTDRVSYEITFTVSREDKEYVVSQPTDNDLKKIHGIYRYDSN